MQNLVPSHLRRPDISSAASTLVIRGGNRLVGTARTAGFKHALVSTVAAALASDQPLRLENCPDIEETRVLSVLLRSLGARAEFSGSVLSVDACGVRTAQLPDATAALIHGSVYLLPALLGRVGSVRLPDSGGCQIGAGPAGRRPTEHYLRVFRQFGARTFDKDGGFVVEADRLVGCELDLLDYTDDRELRTGPLYSGATKTALLTAAMAAGISVLHSPYPKPDVTELVAVLRAFGVPIDEPDAGVLVVHGSGGLLPGAGTPVTHQLIPDLIEVVTWICIGALLSDQPMAVTGPRMLDVSQALAPEREVLAALGVELTWEAERCVVQPVGRLAPVDVLVASHGVFSDSQPLLALLASRAPGRSRITDTVWSNRFGYASGLAALGLSTQRQDNTLVIDGPWCPAASAAPLIAGDLRGAAALLIAALLTPGTTTVAGAHHLARGYPDLPGELIEMGAEIDAVHDPERRQASE